MTDGLGASQHERHASIDVLRGLAVLGILVMNIQDFSMPLAHYVNPHASGRIEGLNYAIWYWSHLLADTKFITIFSALFGASTLLMAEKIERRGGEPAKVYFRRNGVLLVVGLIHAYIFWAGDVLTLYAMCAFIIFWFHKLSASALCVLGLMAVLVPTALGVLAGLASPFFPPDVLGELHAQVHPSAAALEAEIAAYQGEWLDHARYRVSRSAYVHTAGMAYMGWRLAGLMLVGMGLYKFGVLTAAKRSGFYWGWIAAALFIGLPVIHLGVMRMEHHGWDAVRVLFLDGQYNNLASLVVAMGWVSVAMLLCRASWARPLTAPLAAVGRMAFTNYLAQTLLCVTLFHGYGLGWFGTVDHTGQILIVFAIWMLQLAWSPWWLNRFRYGPAEWVWRYLTYGKVPA